MGGENERGFVGHESVLYTRGSVRLSVDDSYDP